MIEIAGKQVFTELSEIVDPAHTALLVVDMQRDFCSADGLFGRLSIGDFLDQRLGLVLFAGLDPGGDLGELVG